MFLKIKSVVVFLKILVTLVLSRPFGQAISHLLITRNHNERSKKRHLQFVIHMSWPRHSVSSAISLAFVSGYGDPPIGIGVAKNFPSRVVNKKVPVGWGSVFLPFLPWYHFLKHT